jgi:hypothetical protein
MARIIDGVVVPKVTGLSDEEAKALVAKIKQAEAKAKGIKPAKEQTNEEND